MKTRTKLTFALGLAGGYVLGITYGRAPIERLTSSFAGLAGRRTEPAWMPPIDEQPREMRPTGQERPAIPDTLPADLLRERLARAGSIVDQRLGARKGPGETVRERY